MHICEIDKKVIEVSKRFLPSLASGYNDPRVTVHIQDGFEYLKQYSKTFDVIIVDSSDPVGPAEVLFQEPFYKAASEALTDSGILCCQVSLSHSLSQTRWHYFTPFAQGECMWLHLGVIKDVKDFASKLFATVEYGFISIPTYPCGTIGMLCCSKDSRYRCSSPTRKADEELLKSVKYYNSDIHRGAFLLPTFVKTVTEQ